MTGCPVVSMPYMPAALMPMPCCPRLIFRRWNFEPYSSLPKIRGICSLTIPGPLSVTTTMKRFSSWVERTVTSISGRMCASSQASRALSTASLIVVINALVGLSKPSRWRFLAKNSLTEIVRWRSARSSAVCGPLRPPSTFLGSAFGRPLGRRLAASPRGRVSARSDERLLGRRDLAIGAAPSDSDCWPAVLFLATCFAITPVS